VRRGESFLKAKQADISTCWRVPNVRDLNLAPNVFVHYGDNGVFGDPINNVASRDQILAPSDVYRECSSRRIAISNIERALEYVAGDHSLPRA
jgi:hypothetical protein